VVVVVAAVHQDFLLCPDSLLVLPEDGFARQGGLRHQRLQGP